VTLIVINRCLPLDISIWSHNSGKLFQIEPDSVVNALFLRKAAPLQWWLT